ncbi:hypothetical protein CEXT_272911 [Caerostris extrusa]|uniref:Uncharacterized protein n=1 Tax=Caerostris extrusa TaxID=172846 RepID=A0AAV4U9A6_CAEEX|nr:hypothetical protein CEXT_272911 [Caerostris extrusa]
MLQEEPYKRHYEVSNEKMLSTSSSTWCISLQPFKPHKSFTIITRVTNLKHFNKPFPKSHAGLLIIALSPIRFVHKIHQPSQIGASSILTNKLESPLKTLIRAISRGIKLNGLNRTGDPNLCHFAARNANLWQLDTLVGKELTGDFSGVPY